MKLTAAALMGLATLATPALAQDLPDLAGRTVVPDLEERFADYGAVGVEPCTVGHSAKPSSSAASVGTGSSHQ